MKTSFDWEAWFYITTVFVALIGWFIFIVFS